MTRLSMVGLCGVAALVGALGCAAPPDNGGAPSRAGAPGAESVAPEPSRAEARAAVDLTEARLEALERGLAREADAVRAAHARARAATTPQARGEAIQAAFENATVGQGAEAAGLPLDEYRQLRTVVDDTLRTLDYQGKIDGPLSVDLARVDAATRARLSRDPLAALSPAAADALRKRMDRLVPVWLEYVRLTAVAG